MTTALVTYVITLILFLGIDLVWLMGPGRPIYMAEIGGLLRNQPNLGAALAFYVLYTIGLTYFAVMPGLKAAMPMQALGLGALFGLMAYATYDLTNLAVINGFTTRIAMIDMAWGCLLSGVVSWLSLKLVMYLGYSLA
jgi:uncharacterized membrane protein